MFHSQLLITVWVFLPLAAAQPHCDPITQYEKEGHCCLKCDPGTSMSSLSSCEEPQCKECGENEYQENYTTASRCERQEYCDPNKNFKWRTHQNKKKRIPCVCEDGFHCSSEVCLTCVPHQKCKPGFGARFIGNHTHDTVCEKCPEGHFSSNNSWNSVCQKWRVCEDNFHMYKEGTGETDVECQSNQSRIVVIPIVVTILVVLGVIGVVVHCKKRSQNGFFKVNEKGYSEAQREEIKDWKPPRDAEKGEQQKPEENEDDPSLSEQTGVTTNGNYVTQEIGKTDVFPRQESQTDTTGNFCSSSGFGLSQTD